MFHFVCWSSHNSNRPVRSIGAPKPLAVSEANEGGIVLMNTGQSTLLASYVKVFIVIDYKVLSFSLSTRRNSIYKSIRADLNVIRLDMKSETII